MRLSSPVWRRIESHKMARAAFAGNRAATEALQLPFCWGILSA